MSKLLISGNGKRFYPTAIVNLIFTIVTLVAGIVLISMVSSRSGSSYFQSSAQRQMQQMLPIIVIIAFIGTILCFIQGILATSKARTKVNVYESYIDGCGIEKSPFAVQEFKLTYDQVINVDVMKNLAIIIHTPYAKYTCYASNANEIKNIVFNILQSRKTND